jgi:sec-independent protein translocase protein TatA
MSLGMTELLLILVIIFVIFGAGKLPRVMGDIGKGVKSLKKGLKDDDNSVKIESEKQQTKENVS